MSLFFFCISFCMFDFLSITRIWWRDRARNHLCFLVKRLVNICGKRTGHFIYFIFFCQAIREGRVERGEPILRHAMVKIDGDKSINELERSCTFFPVWWLGHTYIWLVWHASPMGMWLTLGYWALTAMPTLRHYYSLLDFHRLKMHGMVLHKSTCQRTAFNRLLLVGL